MPKFVQAYFRQTALRAQLWKRVRRIIGMQYVPLRIHADEIIPCVVIATPFPVLFLTLPQAFQRSVPAQKLTATNLLSRGVYGSAFRQSQRAYLGFQRLTLKIAAGTTSFAKAKIRLFRRANCFI